MNIIKQEDQMLYLAERAIADMRKELKRRLKKGLNDSFPFPVSGCSGSPFGQVMVAMEWKPASVGDEGDGHGNDTRGNPRGGKARCPTLNQPSVAVLGERDTDGALHHALGEHDE